MVSSALDERLTRLLDDKKKLDAIPKSEAARRQGAVTAFAAKLQEKIVIGQMGEVVAKINALIP